MHIWLLQPFEHSDCDYMCYNAMVQYTNITFWYKFEKLGQRLMLWWYKCAEHKAVKKNLYAKNVVLYNFFDSLSNIHQIILLWNLVTYTLSTPKGSSEKHIVYRCTSHATTCNINSSINSKWSFHQQFPEPLRMLSIMYCTEWRLLYDE